SAVVLLSHLLRLVGDALAVQLDGRFDREREAVGARFLERGLRLCDAGAADATLGIERLGHNAHQLPRTGAEPRPGMVLARDVGVLRTQRSRHEQNCQGQLDQGQITPTMLHEISCPQDASSSTPYSTTAAGARRPIVRIAPAELPPEEAGALRGARFFPPLSQRGIPP